MDNFFDEDENDFKPKKGLKISQSKTVAPNANKKKIEENFHQQVEEIEKNKKEYQSDLNYLSTQVIRMIQDKTLARNKNNLQKDNEKSNLEQIVNLARELDIDENEPINAGSISLITLILALSLKQRDRLNELEFEVSQLKPASKEK